MQNPKTDTLASRVALITDKEVADMLQISVRHLHRLKSRRDVIQPIKIGKLTRWNLEEVEQWIRNGCLSPASNNSEGERRDG